MNTRDGMTREQRIAELLEIAKESDAEVRHAQADAAIMDFVRAFIGQREADAYALAIKDVFYA